MTPTIEIIDAAEIWRSLESAPRGKTAAREVLAAARDLHGLSTEQTATLIRATDPEVEAELFETARSVKETIYGSRLVLFAPLYISNYCSNECSYCAFRKGNAEARRRALMQEEIAGEVKALVEKGHKRVLMVSGEAYPNGGFEYILDSIRTIYGTRSGNGEIRRVNVNLAPCTLEQFRQLKQAEIGTYQIFQETYHRPTYESAHLAGPKRDYEYRLGTPHRAMAAGIDDIGIGPLLGLYDWRFEILAVLGHAQSLEREHGCGPHTISVPRIEPAAGSEFSLKPEHAVSDHDFLKLIAILRLAVPYTGMIMSTRESAAIRRQTFELGISQISAGSRCDPGGYTESESQTAQFIARSTRSSATSRPWAIRHRSAPPATALAGRAATSWTSPSPAKSSATANRTRFQPSRSTWTISRHRQLGMRVGSWWQHNWRPWNRFRDRSPPDSSTESGPEKETCSFDRHSHRTGPPGHARGTRGGTARHPHTARARELPLGWATGAP